MDHVITLKNTSASPIAFTNQSEETVLTMSAGEERTIDRDLLLTLDGSDWSEYATVDPVILTGLDSESSTVSNDDLLECVIVGMGNAKMTSEAWETSDITSTMLDWIPIETIELTDGEVHTLTIPATADQIKMEWVTDGIPSSDSNAALYARMNNDSNTNYYNVYGYFASNQSTGAFVYSGYDRADILYPGGVYQNYSTRGTWYSSVADGQVRSWECNQRTAESTGSENMIHMGGGWLDTATPLTTITITCDVITARLKISYIPNATAFTLPNTWQLVSTLPETPDNNVVYFVTGT
jgi:hypothetical protein